MITITMDVFSGRPNPAWHLTNRESSELFDRIIDDGVSLDATNSGPSRLGYRGLVVEMDGDSAHQAAQLDLPSTFRIAGSAATARVLESQARAEQWLLGGRGNHADAEVLEHAAAVLGGRSTTTAAVGGADVAIDGSEEATDSGQLELDDDPNSPLGRRGRNSRQTYETTALAAACSIRVTSNSNFSFWNDNGTHRANNNCYNFASNWRNNTFAQPGAASTGKAFWKDSNGCFDDSRMNAWHSKQGCLSDGWTTGCYSSSYKIALVIWHRVDFHFYRRVQSDGSGQRWAHKAGSTAATNRDNSGRLIRNPWACDRGPYTVWSDYLYHRADVNRNITGDQPVC